MALSLLQPNFKLDANEYCYNISTSPVSPGSTMKMYAPKLMNEIGFGEAKTIPVTFNTNGIFANAPDCPHNSGSSLTSQTYLDFELLHNVCDWEHLLSSGRVPKHTQFICHIMNGNVDRRFFSTNNGG